MRLPQPPEGKGRSRSLPLLVTLATLPLSSFPITSIEYTHVLSLLITEILSIQLLPNRIPLASLTALSTQLPLASLNLISPHISSIVASLSALSATSSLPSMTSAAPVTPGSDPAVNLIANLTAFVPPRYSTLPAPALAAYLKLMTALMNALPTSALDPPSTRSKAQTSSAAWASNPNLNTDSDTSDDEGHTRVAVVSSFAPAVSMNRPCPLDPRTRKRLATIPDLKHIHALLYASHRHSGTQLDLVCFFLALTSVWPAIKEKVLSMLVAYGGGGGGGSGGLAREIWREHVRGSKLGKEEGQGGVMGSYTTFSHMLLARHTDPCAIL